MKITDYNIIWNISRIEYSILLFITDSIVLYRHMQRAKINTFFIIYILLTLNNGRYDKPKNACFGDRYKKNKYACII